jgi:hypothetical protein
VDVRLCHRRDHLPAALPNLPAKVAVSVSSIMGGRDTNAADTARNVHAAATANAAFVTDYQNARIIVDAAAGRTSKPTPPTPPNP